MCHLTTWRRSLQRRNHYAPLIPIILLIVLGTQRAEAMSANETEALHKCVVLQKKIGPHGTKDRKYLREADKVIVHGLPMTTERHPIGAKIFWAEKGRFLLE